MNIQGEKERFAPDLLITVTFIEVAHYFQDMPPAEEDRSQD